MSIGSKNTVQGCHYVVLMALEVGNALAQFPGWNSCHGRGVQYNLLAQNFKHRVQITKANFAQGGSPQGDDDARLQTVDVFILNIQQIRRAFAGKRIGMGVNIKAGQDQNVRYLVSGKPSRAMRALYSATASLFSSFHFCQ